MKASELKVTDLMVGNWVICYHPSRLKSFEKVSVGLLHTMQEQEYGHIKEDSPLFRIVEPIPLTPEILEKNGFENLGFAILVLEDGCVLHYYFHEYRLTKYYNNSILFKCECVYVHELQHALKLCGIDKEIVI